MFRHSLQLSVMKFIYIDLLLLLLFLITSMQCMYNYIPATNHVPTVYSVAAVLYFRFVLCVMLFCT